MKKLIIAVSTFILTVPAFVKVSLRSNYPGRVRSLERTINPRLWLFVVAIVLIVAGCTTFKANSLGKEEMALSLSLAKFGNIVAATRADGKPLEYDDEEDKRIDSGDNWIATIGACWRKVEGKWGLQRMCAKSGDEGQEARLRVKIDERGRIIAVEECTAKFEDCIKGESLQPLVYVDPVETMENSKIVGFNHHCWWPVNGVLKCRHEYCN